MRLQGSIRNDDFKRNTALQCLNNVVTIRNNVETMLQPCVALKIVVANRHAGLKCTFHYKQTFNFFNLYLTCLNMIEPFIGDI